MLSFLMKFQPRRSILRHYLWRLLEKIFKFIEKPAQRVGIKLAFQVYDIDFVNTSLTLEEKSPTKVGRKLVGILIQGPIGDVNFINDMVRIYETNFPSSRIVLSTWKDESKISEVRETENLTIIENERPKNSGISNVNLQTVSTFSGIKTLRDLGADFILKTRSDQILLSNRALDLLTYRLDSSPASGYERIVTTDFNSFLFRPYSPNDQLMFGSVETIFRFWSANVERISDISSTKDDFAEKVLLKSYLEDQGLTFDNSHLQSLEIYRDLYSFIDNEDLNLYWNKGTHRSLASRFPQQV